jgi:hypothetical protein
VAIEDKDDILSDGAVSDNWTVTGCGPNTTDPTITSAAVSHTRLADDC